jgi:hypothetical protein
VADEQGPQPARPGACDRRGFLKGAALGTAAIVAGGPGEKVEAQSARGGTPAPSEAAAAAEAGGAAPALPPIIVERPQSDFMVDVLESLGLEYAAANPGSSFDSLQESIINYGGDTAGRLWNMEKHYHDIGGQGAGGMGYGAPASVGAALANRKHGRLSINLQTDGDLCYGPAVLWTAAHYRIPLLTVMHNNRAYHQEVMFMQRMANWHNRSADRARIGTTLTDPNIDYAKMAESFGVHGEGPITDPAELRGALERGIARVKRGEPVLIDVVTQPR